MPGRVRPAPHPGQAPQHVIGRTGTGPVPSPSGTLHSRPIKRRGIEREWCDHFMKPSGVAWASSVRCKQRHATG
jgi:hypothetical protein